MRHTYVLIAILGVCLAAAGQAAKQQPKPKTPARCSPAKPQPPSDEELMAKTAQATIDWDNSTTKGAKVDVLLIKKDQAEGKPVMQYRLKVSGAPKNKLYTLMAWPITIARAGNNDGWPGHCGRRHRGMPAELRQELRPTYERRRT